MENFRQAVLVAAIISQLADSHLHHVECDIWLNTFPNQVDLYLMFGDTVRKLARSLLKKRDRDRWLTGPLTPPPLVAQLFFGATGGIFRYMCPALAAEQRHQQANDKSNHMLSFRFRVKH
jgi:hypothetical protein